MADLKITRGEWGSKIKATEARATRDFSPINIVIDISDIKKNNFIFNCDASLPRHVIIKPKRRFKHL